MKIMAINNNSNNNNLKYKKQQTFKAKPGGNFDFTMRVIGLNFFSKNEHLQGLYFQELHCFNNLFNKIRTTDNFHPTVDIAMQPNTNKFLVSLLHPEIGDESKITLPLNLSKCKNPKDIFNTILETIDSYAKKLLAFNNSEETEQALIETRYINLEAIKKVQEKAQKKVQNANNTGKKVSKLVLA